MVVGTPSKVMYGTVCGGGDPHERAVGWVVRFTPSMYRYELLPTAWMVPAKMIGATVQGGSSAQVASSGIQQSLPDAQVEALVQQ